MNKKDIKDIINNKRDGLDVWSGEVPTNAEDAMNLFREQGFIFQSHITNPQVVFNLVILPFTEHIMISQRQNIKPYKKGYATPKLTMHLKKDIATGSLIYNDKGYLTDLKGNIIPSNKNKAGKPKYWRVNGQDIYNARLNPLARANYLNKLHDYLDPHFQDLPQVTEQGLTLKIGFFIQRGSSNLDNDARHIWGKVIQDILKQRILPEDTNDIICGNYHYTTYVEDESMVRMEVSLIENYK